MKPPSKLLTTPYRPVTGGAGGAGAGGPPGRAVPVPADGLGVGRADSTVDRGESPGTTGPAADVGGRVAWAGAVEAAGVVAGNSGSDIVGAGGGASANVRRPRTEPSATTSRTTMTITPMETMIQGEEAMAAPGDGRTRRVPDMPLPCRSPFGRA
ncbi:hypothetical protein ACWEH1_31735 [Micromonospora chersina]